jgi:EF hand
MFQRAWIVATMMALVLVISNLGASPAAGQSQKPGQPKAGKGSGQVIKRLDTDKDGQLSKAEFEAAKSKAAARGKGKAGAARGKVFDRLDANGDGSLSPTELKKLQELRNRRPGGAKVPK